MVNLPSNLKFFYNIYTLSKINSARVLYLQINKSSFCAKMFSEKIAQNDDLLSYVTTATYPDKRSLIFSIGCYRCYRWAPIKDLSDFSTCPGSAIIN